MLKRLFKIFILLSFVELFQSHGRAQGEQSWAKMVGLFARPRVVPYPQSNHYTRDRELLGKSLFFDPRLSGSNSISCATCHTPSFSWSNGLRRGVGHEGRESTRRSPTLLNIAWANSLFWDGRAATLEEQVLGPLFKADEMHGDAIADVKKVSEIAGYRVLFAKAYPNEPISPEVIAKAIATYERSIVSGIAPFDKYLAGDEKAMSLSAVEGFKLFNSKAKCIICHTGWNFTDGSFHDIGVASQDLGRGRVLSRLLTMQYAFKTPTLRNVALRAPYMHDGSEQTLETVVELYNVGGRIKRPSLSPEIKPLNLSRQEKINLIEFMNALTSVDPPVELPILPTR